MQLRRLGDSDLHVSEISLGSWLTYGVGVDGGSARACVDAAFEAVASHDVEVVQEPADQPWGVRDCAFRDPTGNLVRINEVR